MDKKAEAAEARHSGSMSLDQVVSNRKSRRKYTSDSLKP